MVVSDDVADALVLKLKAAGFDIDLETATCADLMLALDACKIQNPRRFTAGIPADKFQWPDSRVHLDHGRPVG